MLEFYFADTPNAKKVALMLEECSLPHKSVAINLKEGQQKSADFLAKNPNGKIPVLVDNEAAYGKTVAIAESGAILFYLAEKTGLFFGHDLSTKAEIMTWLMWQMSAIGPVFGNYHYANKMMEVKSPPMKERFAKEGQRLLSVLETQLDRRAFMATNEYTIADIATYPWLRGMMTLEPDFFATVPRVRRWMKTIEERPAVQKIYAGG